MKRLLTIYIWLLICTTCPPLYILALLIKAATFWFDRRLVALQQFTCFWGSIYLWLMPGWYVSIFGRNKMHRNKTYLIVSNHQSQLDILVCFRLFKHFKFVSKVEIFKVPFVGWNMTLNRYIKLVRGDKESIEKMMIDCEKSLAEKNSVLFYPEGTRSPDGLIKDFKPGAFILAKKMGVPILPVLISGSNEALPKYEITYKGRQKIWLQVMDEIPFSDFENLSVEGTSAMVREKMIRGLEILNRERQSK